MSQNWYEIPIELPDYYKNWVSRNINSEIVLETPEPHLTLLYGFDPARYDEVDAIVKKYSITSKDYVFVGEPRCGDVSPVILVEVYSEKISKCFEELYKTFPNQHTLINGKFSPHVTLCTLTKQYHTLVIQAVILNPLWSRIGGGSYCT